jgi:hypothetical protein
MAAFPFSVNSKRSRFWNFSFAMLCIPPQNAVENLKWRRTISAMQTPEALLNIPQLQKAILEMEKEMIIYGGHHDRMTCDKCGIAYQVFYFDGEEELLKKVQDTINATKCGEHGERIVTHRIIQFPTFNRT